MYSSVLTDEEKASLSLRRIYSEAGYIFYRMRHFEEYDFYADKKDFLTSNHILTFTDTDGRLMALRPDVTLSVISAKEHLPPGKYFYDEKVYRVPKNSGSFREIAQCGIEHTGELSVDDVKSIVSLAVKSLHAVADGRNTALDIADAGEVSRLITSCRNIPEILKCISAKNIHGLKELGAPEGLIDLAQNGKPLIFPEPELHYDISAVTNIKYYSGLVFKGYIEGIPEAVLSGGQYNLAGVKGAGFAVYLDTLEGLKRD